MNYLKEILAPLQAEFLSITHKYMNSLDGVLGLVCDVVHDKMDNVVYVIELVV